MIKTAFNLFGLAAGVGLTLTDFHTSVVGLDMILPETGNFLMSILPYILSMLALAFNARASRMVAMFRNRGDETEFGMTLLLAAFGVCVVFDGVSSWAGIMAHTTGQSSVGAAIDGATAEQWAASIVIAMLTTLGPFIATLFSDLLAEEGGVFGGAFGK